jgi:hypothetical protein
MVRLIVDSSARDRTKWPASDEYDLVLEDPIQHAAGVTLVTTDVPFTASTVGPGSDRLRIFAGGTITEVAVDHGDYADAGAIQAALQIALRREFPNSRVDLQDGGLLELVMQQAFELRDVDATDSLAYALGLPTRVVTHAKLRTPGGAEFTMLGLRPPQLDGERYLVLHTTFGGVVAGRLKSPTNNITNATGIVRPGVCDVHKACMAPLQPVLSQLRKIHIRLTRPDGGRYDFRGADHCLEFLVRT